MTASGQILAAFSSYGLPVLFAVVLLGSAGLPVPGVVVVIAAGALVKLGEMNFGWVLVLTWAGAVLGDNLGYAIGRYGGQRLVDWLIRRIGGESQFRRAQSFAARWGGLGVFFSRWVLTPLGSLLNLTSGMAAYPYRRFLLFDVAGETLWAIEYVVLGELLSDRVATLVDLATEVPWVLVGLAGTVIFGRLLVKYLRRS